MLHYLKKYYRKITRDESKKVAIFLGKDRILLKTKKEEDTGDLFDFRGVESVELYKCEGSQAELNSIQHGIKCAYNELLNNYEKLDRSLRSATNTRKSYARTIRQLTAENREFKNEKLPELEKQNQDKSSKIAELEETIEAHKTHIASLYDNILRLNKQLDATKNECLEKDKQCVKAADELEQLKRNSTDKFMQVMETLPK